MKSRYSLMGSMALVTAVLLSGSGQVAAQGQSASAAAMMEEIVVTARRREENLQDLPLSIQAISADAMTAQGIYNIEAISDFVPNVSLTEDQRKNDTRIFIRGIGGGFSNTAMVFGVGMYVDGHYLSGSLNAFMSTVDIERVEVLRGPQGTMFGKNTTGGAISIVSAKPGPDFDSYVTMRAGGFGQTDLRAMVNAPVTDNLFLRGNYSSEQNDGWYFNRFTNQSTGGTDQQSLGLALRWEVSDNWTIDGRLTLAEDRDSNQGGQCVARPNTGAYYDLLNNPANDPDGDPSAWTALPFTGPDLLLGTADDVTYTGPGPFTEFGVGFWGSRNDNVAYRPENLPGGSNIRVDALYPGAQAVYMNSCDLDFTSGNVFQNYQDANVYSYADNDMITLDATWHPDGAVGPFERANVQIKGGWRFSEYSYYQDRDMGPGIIDHIGNYPKGEGIKRYTDEFEVIFTGELSDRLTLTAGAYYFDDIGRGGNGSCLGRWIAAYDPNAGPISDVTGAPEGTINGLPDDDIICEPEGGTFFHRLPDTVSDDRGSQSFGQTITESKALYGHLAWDINDQWTMDVGARWMEDTRKQAHTEFNIQEGSCHHTQPGDNPPVGFCEPLYLLNRSTLIEDGLHYNGQATYDDVAPMVSLTRHLNPGNTIDSGMIYGTIAEGYLTGAFNDEINPSNPGFTPEVRANILAIIPYGPEYVTNYEVGFKGTLFDGQLQLAADVFLMDYTDKQEAIEVDNSDGRFGPESSLEYTQNAASAEMTGIEVELRASPWEGGFVSLDLGTLDSSYTDFLITNLDDPTGPPTDVSNQALTSRTPEWSITATVEHAFLLDNGATLTPQLGVYMQDDYEWFGGLDNGQSTPHCHQDSYSKWRTRLTYEPADADWQASLYGYNITDEEILYRCANVRTTYKTLYQMPEQWGVEFTMRFGGS